MGKVRVRIRQTSGIGGVYPEIVIDNPNGETTIGDLVKLEEILNKVGSPTQKFKVVAKPEKNDAKG